MTPRAMVAQTRKLSQIAEFAFGHGVHVAIDMDCNSHTFSGKGPRPPEIVYDVYVASPEGGVRYTSSEWKDVLALITWLEDVEAKTTFRSR